MMEEYSPIVKRTLSITNANETQLKKHRIAMAIKRFRRFEGDTGSPACTGKLDMKSIITIFEIKNLISFNIKTWMFFWSIYASVMLISYHCLYIISKTINKRILQGFLVLEYFEDIWQKYYILSKLCVAQYHSLLHEFYSKKHESYTISWCR